MPSYSTLSEAVNDLQRRGYTDDLALAEHCLVCYSRGLSLDHLLSQVFRASSIECGRAGDL